MKLPKELRPSARLVFWLLGIIVLAALSLWALDIVLGMLDVEGESN